MIEREAIITAYTTTKALGIRVSVRLQVVYALACSTKPKGMKPSEISRQIHQHRAYVSREIQILNRQGVIKRNLYEGRFIYYVLKH